MQHTVPPGKSDSRGGLLVEHGDRALLIDAGFGRVRRGGDGPAWRPLP
ncbi:hypothetical protein HDA32_002711 [Spinactinospora alkalitolerans]|uniref:Uncharacterized protein n=1 Tax=Spinactinospora alkalitolerans TaxID=687207 RepID=A0A852TV73_9ACTN|nr:hypothetical protein [Spinactinospora alkalitolerans]NYE47591.1 hypothetical protein [Spinactinospora alkalitolerans]